MSTDDQQKRGGLVPIGKPRGSPRRRDAAGFKALIAWIEVPVRAVTYEPTGTVAPRLRGSAAQGRVAVGACQPVARATLCAGHRPTGLKEDIGAARLRGK